MQIKARQLGQRFGREIIFSKLDLTLQGAAKTAILGNNGSGKSTLLNVLAGALSPTKGELNWSLEGEPLNRESLPSKISFSSPAMELLEGLSAPEMISFYAKLKPMKIQGPEILKLSQLENQKSKPISAYSSGMKQRLKLALTITADCPFLFLDEPCSNLDAQFIQWYQEVIDRFAKEKMVFVASNNQQDEYFCCPSKIQITDFK